MCRTRPRVASPFGATETGSRVRATVLLRSHFADILEDVDAFSCPECAALVAFLAGPHEDRGQAGRVRLAAPSIHPSAIPRLSPSSFSQRAPVRWSWDHSLSTTGSALLPSEHVEGCEFLAPVRLWETPERTKGTEALTTLSKKRAPRH